MNFKNCIYLLLILVLLLNHKYIFAQGASSFNNHIVPPSPTVGALQKYINYPVSLSTGVPQVGIPIYSIGIKGLDYPIALSYHASGIKVGDVASNVGLGWSLSANGMINISANGLLDERSGFDSNHAMYTKIKNGSIQGGYLGNYTSCSSLYTTMDNTLPFRNLLQLYGSSGDLDFLREVIYSRDESEPDLYTFNSATIGGKFFQDENNIFRTIPATDNKIERTYNGDSSIKGYKVTDGKGITYFFELWQGNHSVTASSGSLDVDERFGREYYLTKITTPQGGQLDFHYSGVAYYDYQLVRQYSRAHYLTYPCTDYNTVGGLYSYDSYSTTTVGQIPNRLDSIVANNGTKVAFSYSTTYRKDLPANTDKALTEISVTYHGSTIKTASFSYDYFNSASPTSTDYNDFRLKLSSVQLSGEQPYSFAYNATPLPNRLSLSLDHYGYYNGQGNSTLLPIDVPHGFTTGGNRNIDTAYTKAATLTKVTYPTGGFTEYIYDANDYYIANNTVIQVATTGGALTGTANHTDTTSFNVPNNSTALLIYYNNTWDGVNLANDYCYIHITGPDGFSRDYFNSNPAGESMHVGTSQALAEGHYTVSINTFGTTYSGNVYFTWYQDTTIAPHNELAGGLRVKQIKSFAANNQLSFEKEFEYVIPGTTHSSGKNINPPTYLEWKEDSRQILNPSTNSCSAASCQYVAQSSNSVYPIINGDGYTVAYSDVDAYDVDKTQNGYTHYLFNNYGSIPYTGLNINYDWYNGKLLQKDTYKYAPGGYVRVSKQVNQYNYDAFDEVNYLYKNYGAKITMYTAPSFCDNCGVSGTIGTYLDNIQFGVQYYKYYSSFHCLTQSEDITYDSNGLNPIATTSNYYYDNTNHLQLTRTVSTKSDGKVVTSVTTYPNDYASGTAFLDDMKTNHLTALPVEQVSYQNDGTNTNILSGKVTKYQTGGRGLVDKIYSWESVTPQLLSSFKFSDRATGQLPYGTTVAGYGLDGLYQDKVTFNQYDSQGNPQMLTPTGGAPVSYLWGYSNTYPIAQADNASIGNIFHQNFEETEGNSSANDAHTGHKSKTGGYTHSLSGLDNGSYMLSYWLKSGSAWTLQSSIVTVSTGGYAISLSGQVDDVCFYPAAAQITTWTYDPLVGMTSTIDAKGITSYYEYDPQNRLLAIKDQYGNILKYNNYNYAH